MFPSLLGSKSPFLMLVVLTLEDREVRARVLSVASSVAVSCGRVRALQV